MNSVAQTMIILNVLLRLKGFLRASVGRYGTANVARKKDHGMPIYVWGTGASTMYSCSAIHGIA